MERAVHKSTGTSEGERDKEMIDQLSGRERDVLWLISRGLSNAEIATELFITEGTVKNHVSSLLAKCQVRDRTQLALLAQKNMT